MPYCALAVLPALSACAPAASDKVDWDRINYANIDCNVTPKPAGCKASEADMNAVSSTMASHGGHHSGR